MKVSILIPVYNASKYLSVCLESVYNQTYSDVEVVIIDDGSVDNSLEIIKEYADEKTIIISRENRGINQTRKELVLNSTG
ncbi:glycosyltransferase, partial [Vibrio parahaemolyticus]|nr:glycosyltransferase [Vibrio parahaemolyticus]